MEEDDEVAEQLFLAGRIATVVADGVTTDGYQQEGYFCPFFSRLILFNNSVTSSTGPNGLTTCRL